MSYEPFDAKARAADTLDLFDPDDLPMPYFVRLDESEAAGLEPFATATAHAIVSLSSRWLGAESLVSILSLAQVVPYFDRCGRIRQADDAVARILSAIREIDEIDATAQRHLLDFAAHLGATNRIASAEILFQKLLSAAHHAGQGKRRLEVESEHFAFLNWSRGAGEGRTYRPQIYDVVRDLAEFFGENDIEAALTCIDKLVEELKSLDYNDFRLLWNCLTHCTQILVDKKLFREAESISQTLIEIFVGKWSEDAALLSVLFERAIYANLLELNEEDEWHRIESILVNEPSFMNREASRSADMPLNLPYLIGYKLRQCAVAYGFCGESQKALAIMKRAHAKTFSKLSELEIRVRQQRPREHEVAEFYAHADLAVIAIKARDFSLAQRAAASIYSFKEIQSTQNTADKTLQIADAFIECGKLKDAKAFILSVKNLQPRLFEKSGMRDFHYVWKLAAVAAAEGNNETSYQFAVTAAELAGPQRITVGLALLCARQAAFCGDYSNSARYYFTLQDIIETDYLQGKMSWMLDSKAPFYNDISIQLLETALSADAVKTCFSPVLRARIHVVLAKIYAQSDHQIASSQLSKALRLVPLNAEISVLQASLNRECDGVEKSLQQEEWSNGLSVKLTENVIAQTEHAWKLFVESSKPNSASFRSLVNVKDSGLIDLFSNSGDAPDPWRLL